MPLRADCLLVKHLGCITYSNSSGNHKGLLPVAEILLLLGCVQTYQVSSTGGNISTLLSRLPMVSFPYHSASSRDQEASHQVPQSRISFCVSMHFLRWCSFSFCCILLWSCFLVPYCKGKPFLLDIAFFFLLGLWYDHFYLLCHSYYSSFNPCLQNRVSYLYEFCQTVVGTFRWSQQFLSLSSIGPPAPCLGLSLLSGYHWKRSHLTILLSDHQTQHLLTVRFGKCSLYFLVFLSK